MIEIKKYGRMSMCNNCGVVWNPEREIFKLRCSLEGEGWATLFLCENCLREMKEEIMKIVP